MAPQLVLLIFSLLFWPSNCQIKFCAKSCPVNEVYANEVSQCQNTCFNQKFNQTFKCVTSPGCVCKAGYIRDQETFKCISVDTCSLKRGSKNCPSNEFYSDCDCFKTCQTRFLAVPCKCVKGCACRTGYVRSDINFQCVPEKSCPNCPVGYLFSQASKQCTLNCKSCKANETFKTCGNFCSEPTCSNPTSVGVFCTQQCQEGCFCNRGYVRNGVDGSCVLQNNCSKCPENESLKCENFSCERTCQNFKLPCQNVSQPCKLKCYCDTGYIRALDGGQCVDNAQCPIINSKY